jgi:RimJ/RimL family protein N-acetyltransferase
VDAARWPRAELIETERLTLEPLRVEHAEELAALLDDQRLHRFTGGHAPQRDQLRARYRRQTEGQSPDGTRGWLNWVVRNKTTTAPVGTMQATLFNKHSPVSAELAWVVAVAQQGNGYAKEAAAAMVDWLRARGVGAFVAHVHPDHAASAAIAMSVGMIPTDVLVNGEVRWISRSCG